MVFNSVTFFVFLALVLAAYWTIPASRRNLLLLVASYVFYGWWDWRFLSLLAISTVVDFTIGHVLFRTEQEGRRKALLFTSVGVNLGILGVFKYANFFADGFADMTRQLGFDTSPVFLEVILPVGISFYTFQTLSYTFDIYRRRIDPSRSIIDFGTYVAYFPQLVAGPIERAERLLPQIHEYERHFPRDRDLMAAIQLIVLGLFKKVVLADGVATVANSAFDVPEQYSWLALANAVVAFAIQIYGDFCGYTDIARGVSKLLGIELVVNFREPYLSRNITEFWRRWHISLSDWLRDYLYIPLGGNRGGNLATYRNLMLTMLFGGLWHGASWNFVIWGGLHGTYLVVHKLVRGGTVPGDRLKFSQLPSIMLTFAAVCFAWIFFRAATLDEATTIIERIVTFAPGLVSGSDLFVVAALGSTTLAIDLWQRKAEGAGTEVLPGLYPPETPVRAGLALGAVAAAVLIFSGATPQPFIYFQF